MSSTTPLLLFLYLAALTLAPLCPAQTAVNINWGSGAQNITGDTNVSTLGTLVQATNLGEFATYWLSTLGTTSTTVNGVTFAGVHVPSDVQSLIVGDFVLSEDPAFLTSFGSLIPNQYLGEPANNLSSDYRQLLVGAASTYTPSGSGGERTVRLTMPTLTVGQTYQFQWWSNFSEVGASLFTLATGGLTLNANTGAALGGQGQFAVGTFPANDTSMYIEFNGAGNLPIINAFQLRDITAVPEPSTYAIALASVALVGAFYRRRKLAVDLARH